MTCPQWTEETIREIHAAWLLTPRSDLGGASPREVAMTQLGHLEWDLQDRCEQWSRLGECPRGLDKSSFAFRYGGFGTHELVEYYELVRALLRSSWDHLASQTPETLSSVPSTQAPPTSSSRWKSRVWRHFAISGWIPPTRNATSGRPIRSSTASE